MPIESSNPTVVPAQPETTFPFLGFPSIRIDWPDPNTEPVASYQSRNFRADQTGQRQWAPSGPNDGTLENLFTQAATRRAAGDPRLAVAVDLILAVLAGEVEGPSPCDADLAAKLEEALAMIES